MLFVFTSTTKQGNPRPARDTPSILKALYIYNFATLTDWPSDYRKGDFVIGVLSSSDNVYNELKKKYNDLLFNQKSTYKELEEKQTIELTKNEKAYRELSKEKQEDYDKCRAVCERLLGDVPTNYVIADVCRPELLVEIEAVAFSDIKTKSE